MTAPRFLLVLLMLGYTRCCYIVTNDVAFIMVEWLKNICGRCILNLTKNDQECRVMHKMIASCLKTFCTENCVSEGTGEDKQFELFSNYCIIKSFYPEEIDAEAITSGNDDCGIDGICFIIDGEVVASADEAKAILSRPKRNFPVDVYFIQSKTSDNYDRGEILKFGDGVCDFLSDVPRLPPGDFIKEQKEIFDLLIDNVSKIVNGRANVHLKYVCTSSNPIAKEIDATRDNIIENVRSTGYFNDVEFEYVGLQQLMQLWDRTRYSISAVMQTNKLSPYPEMPGVTQAYLAIVPLKEFVEKVLMDADKRLRVHIFEENVRAFLGVDNPVNKQIQQTIIDSEAQRKFAILNNGITIISPDVRVQNDKISIENYQIVNGCQTSNVLFENYSSLIPDSTLTVKIIEATDPDVISTLSAQRTAKAKWMKLSSCLLQKLFEDWSGTFLPRKIIPDKKQSYILKGESVSIRMIMYQNGAFLLLLKHAVQLVQCFFLSRKWLVVIRRS